MPPPSRTQPARAKAAAAQDSKSKKGAASPAKYQIKIKPATPKKAKPALSVKLPATNSKPKKGKTEKRGKGSPPKLLTEEFVPSETDDESEESQKKTITTPQNKSLSAPARGRKSADPVTKSPNKEVASPRTMKPSDSSSEESTDSEEVKQPSKQLKLSSSSSKPVSRAKPGSESEDEDTESDSDTGRKTPRKEPLTRKNLSLELEKAKPTNDLRSDSENETFESADEDEDDLREKHKSTTKNKSKGKDSASAQVKLEDETDDVLEGEKVLTVMSDEDLKTLVDRLFSACQVLDSITPSKRARLLKWDAIAFSEWDGEACRKVWAYLSYKRRVRRNMWEILNEVQLTLNKNIDTFRRKAMEKSHDYPKKPPGITGAVSMYVHEKYTAIRDQGLQGNNYMEVYSALLKQYNTLPETEKASWKEKSDAAAAQYRKSLEEFYSKIPGLENRPEKSKSKPKAERKKSPPKLSKAELYKDAPKLPEDPLKTFIQSKLDKLDEPPLQDEKDELITKYGREYHNLKDSKKVKWIDKVIKNVGEYYSAAEEYKKIHPKYQPPKSLKLSSLLSKGELSLWDASQGKPAKPPTTPIEVYEKELVENGDEELLECTSEADRKASLNSKWDKLNLYSKQTFKIKQQQLQLEYCQGISDYFTSLPEFLRPLLISSLDSKTKKYLSTVDDGSQKSPRKRKEKAGTSEPPASPPKKRKRKKIADINIQDVLNEVEETGSELRQNSQSPPPDADPSLESPGKKKKKKKSKNAIDEVIRGIFDARQSLGRKYSPFYYYSLYVTKTKYWITKIDSIGVYKTAVLITQTFIELEDRQKVVFITHSYDHHKEKYYGVKPESVKDSAFFKQESSIIPEVQFPGEPIAPPINGLELYNGEMKRLRQSGSFGYQPAWKDLDEDTQQLYIKKLYGHTKDYVAKFEEFVGKMTPYDLIEYSVCKSQLWEKNLKTIKSGGPTAKEFVFPLPRHDLSEDDEDVQPEVVHDDDIKYRLREERNRRAEFKGSQSQYKNDFNTDNFIAAISEWM